TPHHAPGWRHDALCTDAATCARGCRNACTPAPPNIATARRRANMHKRTRCMVCREKFPPACRFFCDCCYRGRKPPGNCATCGRRLPASYHGGCRYWSTHCRTYKLPAVYRWVCPDGRSYVGSTYNHKLRPRWGIKPSNSRLASAIKKYPAETWTFELLQLLPPACAVPALRAAEQHHIERLHTRDHKHGFNILPAVFARSKKQPHGRQHHVRSQQGAP